MKKLIIGIIALVVCGNVIAGEVGLPVEKIALPAVSGNHLVCIWDETEQTWLQSFSSYDQTGSYSFQVPTWGRWYWIGLWDEAKGQYVFGKWIGHFKTI